MVEKVTDAAKRICCLHAMLHVVDNQALIVENCRRIVELNEVLVRLQAGQLQILVWGQALRVSDLNANGVRVDGCIQSIELLPQGA